MKNAFDQNEQLINTKAKIIAGMERLSTIYRAILQSEVNNIELSPLQIQMITLIGFQKKSLCTTTIIAKELSVTKGTVSDSIRVLMNKDLVKKNRSNKDSRSFVFTLTQKGKAKLKRLNFVTETINHSIGQLNDNDISDIWKSLAKLLASLQQIGGIPSRMCYTCQHYEPIKSSANKFQCNLLDKQLDVKYIRLDCQEHCAA